MDSQKAPTHAREAAERHLRVAELRIRESQEARDKGYEKAADGLSTEAVQAAMYAGAIEAEWEAL